MCNAGAGVCYRPHVIVRRSHREDDTKSLKQLRFRSQFVLSSRYFESLPR